MKYKLIILLFILYSCTQNYSNLEKKKIFTSKGFAYIYDKKDYEDKVINKKLDENLSQIAHNQLKPGTLIKIINIKTNDSIILKNSKKINYPDFYKILITQGVANKINLQSKEPIVEIVEIKKNKSFVAKKSKIFKEEETIHSNAPVENVKILNISKNKKVLKKEMPSNYYIVIGQFYSKSSASNLKKRIKTELKNFDTKKLRIKSKKMNKITLLSGPYSSINLMKNDYIQLKKFGFEALDISINE